MKLRWRYIILSLAMALLLGFAYLNQAFFLTYLIEPIAGILWLVYRTFLSVDQEIYWALLILTALIMILRMIPNKPEDVYHPAYHNSLREDDRVAYWEDLLQSAEGSEKDRLALKYELEALRRSIGALAEGNDEEDILLPPYSIDFRQRIRAAWMVFPFTRIIPRKTVLKATELEKYVDIIVKLMETKMENHHDGISNRANDD